MGEDEPVAIYLREARELRSHNRFDPQRVQSVRALRQVVWFDKVARLQRYRVSPPQFLKSAKAVLLSILLHALQDGNRAVLPLYEYECDRK